LRLTDTDHDSDYFRRRAAEARASAFCKEQGESVEIAGDLALAYAALAKRKSASPPAILAEAESAPELVPLTNNQLG